MVTQALVLQEVVKSRERGAYDAPPGTLGAGERCRRLHGAFMLGSACTCACRMPLDAAPAMQFSGGLCAGFALPLLCRQLAG